MACQGTTKAGKPCKAAPPRGADYCRAHDPDLPDSTRFGSTEQATDAGHLGGRPKLPRPHEVMRDRIESEIDAVLEPYFAALTGAVAHSFYEGELVLSDEPDYGARIAAAEKLLDRVYGRPRQQLEHTGHNGAPIKTEGTLDVSSPKVREHLSAALAASAEAELADR